MVFLLLIIFFSYNQQSYAINTWQNTIQSFDQSAFKASLKELPPKEFARLFTQQYREDSIKANLSIEYIENDMLNSENLYAQFWGHFALAYWYNQALNQEKSIANLDKALSIGASLKDDNLILNSLQYKGKYYFDFGRYEEAMEHYLEALKVAKKIEDKVRQQVISHDIGLIKMQTNDYEGGIELIKGILDEIQNEKPYSLHINIYISLTKGYIGLGEYKQAKLFCEKGLELSEELNSDESKFYFYSFLAEIAMHDTNFEKAHELIEKSLRISENTNTLEYEIPMLYIEKGEVYYKEKKFDNAILYLLKAEKLLVKYKLDFIKQEEMYALLAKSYKEKNDIENSLKYYEKANEVYKENDKRQGNISADIIKKYDLKSLKDELLAAEQSSKRTKNVLIVSIFIALTTVLSIIFFYKKREKNNQRKFEALLKSIENEKEEVEIEVEKTETKKIVQAEVKEVEIIDETKAKLLKKLDNFEVKQLYLSKHCSLNEVAKKLKTNTSYLSKLVNAHKGKSFTAYITDLRVNYAVKRLKNDKKFRSYTIDSIAQEIGFNRSESFSRAFKNKTGLYPSYFIKNLDNQNIG